MLPVAAIKSQNVPELGNLSTSTQGEYIQIGKYPTIIQLCHSIVPLSCDRAIKTNYNVFQQHKTNL